MMTFILSFLMMSAAQASDVSGKWTGPGTMTMKDLIIGAQTKPCTQVSIEILQSQKQIKINAYKAQCGFMNPDFKDWIFDINNGKVFMDGDEVGTFDGILFLTTMPDNGATYAFNFKMDQDIKGPLLKSYYGVKNMTGIIVIEGELRH